MRLPELHREAQRHPHDPERWLLLGRELASSSSTSSAQDGSQDVELDRVAAATALRHAASLDPVDARTCRTIGIELAGLGELDDAAAILERALLLDPSDERAALCKAEVEILRGNVERAVGLLCQLRDIHPHSTKTLLALTRALRREGAYERARRTVLQALALQPDDREALALSATLSSELGDTEAAVVVWRRLVLLDPDDLEALTALAVAASKAELHDEAIAAAREVAARRPDAGTSYFNLAVVLRRAGATDEAIVALRHGVSLAPSDAAASWELADLLSERRAWSEAQAVLERLIASKPDHLQGHRALARARQALGDHRGCVDALTRAVALAPDDESLRVQLSAALRETTPETAATGLAGNLAQVDLATTLEFIRLQAVSGVLEVQGPQGHGTVALEHGRVVAVDVSQCATPGTLAIELGLVEGEALTAFACAVGRDVAGLGFADITMLLDRGILEPGEVEALSREHAVRGMTKMLGWTEGRFRFERGESSPDSIAKGFDASSIVLEALRRLDERGQEPSSAPAEW